MSVTVLLSVTTRNAAFFVVGKFEDMSKNRVLDLTGDEWSNKDLSEEIKGILHKAMTEVEDLLETQEDEYMHLDAENTRLRQENASQKVQINKFELQVTNGRKQLKLLKKNEKLWNEQKEEYKGAWKDAVAQADARKEEIKKLRVEIWELHEKNKALKKELKAKSEEAFDGFFASTVSSKNFEESLGLIVLIIDQYESYIADNGNTAAHVNLLWELSARSAKDSHTYASLLAKVFADKAKGVSKGEKGHVKIVDKYAAFKNLSKNSGEKIPQEG